MTFLIQQTLIYAIPLMIVALAGVFAERSGIINLALEGIMIFGAFIGVLFVNIVQQTDFFATAYAEGNYLALQGLELLASWGLPADGSLRGVGNCILGYAEDTLPEPKPRRDNVVYVK